VVSNTYCVVFLFCLSSSCVPYVVRFAGLSIFSYYPLGFSNIYFLQCDCVFKKTYINHEYLKFENTFFSDYPGNEVIIGLR